MELAPVVWLFWLSVFFILYTYLIYGGLLHFLTFFRRKGIKRGDITPPITIIVPCYNEEKIIRRKIENTLACDYPREQVEIIVASDCSADSSDEIVREYADRGVRLVRQKVRKGKHFAQGLALQHARGSIIVFTDISLDITPDGLKKIVSNFADNSIGCVSSRDKIVTIDGDVSSEGLYIRYDMRLRHLESQFCSSTGMTGAFYAVRKELCNDWIPELSNDFYLPLKAVMEGFRTIVDQRVIGLYRASQDPMKEYTRKVRTIVHGIDVLFRFRPILNPLKYGFFSIEVLSHKLFRWLVPFAAIVALACNAALVGEGLIYKLTLATQILIYLFAALARFIPPLVKSALFKVPYFLVGANAAVLSGWVEWLRGERHYSWEPTER